MKKLIFLMFLLFLPLYKGFAAEDYYHFNSVEEQQRFAFLTSELRCLVCQNQNLAESNSGLASDLRDQIYSHIQQGQSNQEIIHYLVSRYGNFILYRPPFIKKTIALWLTPFLLLIIGLSYLINYIVKRQRETSC